MLRNGEKKNQRTGIKVFQKIYDTVTVDQKPESTRLIIFLSFIVSGKFKHHRITQWDKLCIKILDEGS